MKQVKKSSNCDSHNTDYVTFSSNDVSIKIVYFAGKHKVDISRRFDKIVIVVDGVDLPF